MTTSFHPFAKLLRGAAVAATLGAFVATPVSAQYQIDNDYPTVAIADYVLGCMAANGWTRQALERCSCSIDVISSLLTYKDYVEAETVLGVGQVTGQAGEYFRANSIFDDMVANLRRAQAEAEVQCF